jgi:hypothetical protein
MNKWHMLHMLKSYQCTHIVGTCTCRHDSLGNKKEQGDLTRIPVGERAASGQVKLHARSAATVL